VLLNCMQASAQRQSNLAAEDPFGRAERDICALRSPYLPI